MQAVIGAAAADSREPDSRARPDQRQPVVYGLWAIALGAVQLALAIHFALHRDERSARLLLRATLVYLPAWLAMLLMVSV